MKDYQIITLCFRILLFALEPLYHFITEILFDSCSAVFLVNLLEFLLVISCCLNDLSMEGFSLQQTFVIWLNFVHYAAILQLVQWLADIQSRGLVSLQTRQTDWLVWLVDWPETEWETLAAHLCLNCLVWLCLKTIHVGRLGIKATAGLPCFDVAWGRVVCFHYA